MIRFFEEFLLPHEGARTIISNRSDQGSSGELNSCKECVYQVRIRALKLRCALKTKLAATFVCLRASFAQPTQKFHNISISFYPSSKNRTSWVDDVITCLACYGISLLYLLIVFEFLIGLL